MRLNLNLLERLFIIFLILNSLFAICFLGGALWSAEKNTAILMDSYNGTNASVISEQIPGYQVVPLSDTTDGASLFDKLNDGTPLKEYKVTRSLSFAQTPFSFDKETFSSLVYTMRFPPEDIAITYRLGLFLVQFWTLFHILFIAECILLLLEIIRGARSNRNILRPLSDMTRQAQDLTSRISTSSPHEQSKHLRQLTGTISNIDATTLDQRLPVDEAQRELKDLAGAINNMLTRIDEAYRAQVRFVSDASHELRTPIAVIQGYANLLDRWGKNNQETMQEAIDAIKGESSSMKDLIEQLLFLARGDNETLQLYPEDFSASEMLEEIIKETIMINPTHTLQLKMQSDVFLKNADRQLIKQALRILIDNSIKYTPQNSEIAISLSREDGTARICVQDNGIGIDPESLPHIFDRFYRSDESRARKTGGSGLGLSIMKWIIDRHGGSIEVVSRKGIGTKTSILLPAKDQD